MQYQVTAERIYDCKRFTHLFEAATAELALRQAYSLLNRETADYYVISVEERAA